METRNGARPGFQTRRKKVTGARATLKVPFTLNLVGDSRNPAFYCKLALPSTLCVILRNAKLIQLPRFPSNEWPNTVPGKRSGPDGIGNDFRSRIKRRHWPTRHLPVRVSSFSSVSSRLCSFFSALHRRSCIRGPLSLSETRR